MQIIRTEKQKDNLAKFFWDMAKVVLTLLFVTPIAQTGRLTLHQSIVAGWLLDGREVK